MYLLTVLTEFGQFPVVNLTNIGSTVVFSKFAEMPWDIELVEFKGSLAQNEFHKPNHYPHPQV